MKIESSFRQIRGKVFLSKLRKDGKVPAVLYRDNSHSAETISAEKTSLQRALRQMGSNREVVLAFERDQIDAVVKDVSVHPISGEIEHVDFARK